MHNLFYLLAGFVLTIHSTACHVKDTTFSTTTTSWRYSEGALQLRDTSLPITVYQKGANDHRSIRVPYKQGQYELTVPYASVYTFTLPNGTTVRLNSGSTLLFDPLTTIMHLTGEAMVQAFDTAATVYISDHEFVHGERGAMFNISSYNDYPTEKDFETVLLSGAVMVNARNFRDTLLYPGQTLVCNKRTFDRYMLISDTKEVVSWATNEEHYSKIAVTKMLHKIGRRYGLQVEGEEKIINHCISYKGKDVKSVDKNMNQICQEYSNYCYTVQGKKLMIYDLEWIMGAVRKYDVGNSLN